MTEAWWRDALESDEPMVAVDECNDVVAANDAAVGLFAPMDPATGWRTIRHPDLLLLTYVDVNVVRPGRAVARVRPLVTRVRTADGRPGSLIWLRDVTEETGRQRRLDRSAHRWSHVLESLPDPVFLVLRSGEVEFSNVAGAALVERIIGVRPGDDEVLQLRSLLDALDGPTGSAVRTLLDETFAAGEPRGPVTVTVRHSPGAAVELLVRTVVLAVGDEVLAVLAARDVTVEQQATRQVGMLNEELRAAVAASEVARVEERERVARAIHDDTLQRLTVLRWLLSDAVPRGLDAAAVSELDDLIVALRDVMTSLHSPVPDLGLAEALQQLAQQTATRTTVRCPASAAKVPLPVAEMAFRSVREALRNVDTHASAGSAAVVVKVGKGALRITVSDDGRGVSPEAVAAAARAGRLGIVSTRESVLAEGGTFELAAGPRGTGTTLTVTIPLR
ncbi:MAG: ATP-binding protein [Ilumatobacteraceae bacterium]